MTSKNVLQGGKVGRRGLQGGKKENQVTAEGRDRAILGTVETKREGRGEDAGQLEGGPKTLKNRPWGDKHEEVQRIFRKKEKSNGGVQLRKTWREG